MRFMAVGMFACGLGAAAAASELDFSYQSRMPAVQGTLERSISASDTDRGLYVTKRVFGQEAPGFSILTHVAEVACGEVGAAAPRPYIIALQYLPKEPQSFAAATLIDGFTEVYVEDEAGRVRLYRNVSGAVMAQLTERFRPACPAV